MRDELDRVMDSMGGDEEANHRLKVIIRYLGGALTEEEARRTLSMTRIELVETAARAFQAMQDALVDDEDEETRDVDEGAGDEGARSAGA